MEYEIGSRIRILPDTEMWREFQRLCDGEEWNLQDNNEWIVDEHRREVYDIYVHNILDEDTSTWCLKNRDCELIPEVVTIDPNKPIEVGDKVTRRDEEWIERECKSYNVTENELWAIVTREHSLKGAWHFKWNHKDYEDAAYAKDLKQYTGISVPQELTTITKQYPFIKECLDDMYGDNYDIREEESILRILKGEIILKFPEVAISNTNNESHLMKDLYVKLDFRNGKLQRHMYGFRGLLSAKEYQADYNHSHLPSGRNNDWRNFCLGSGTEIEFLLAECNNDFTEENFMRLLAMIDTYVGHESIEGGPHIRMSDIHTSESSSRSISSGTIEHEYTFLKSQITENLPLKYIHDDYVPKFEIDTNSPELAVIMNKYITTKSQRNKTNGEILDTNSTSVDVPRANAELKERYEVHIIYKGDKVYKQVEEQIVDVDLSVYEEVANTYVVSEVLKKLNKDLEKFIIG